MLAARGDGAAAEDALQKLCQDSWRPLYAFARRWGRNPEDAEDSVQGFLGSLLRRDSFKHVERERGRFRTFLLGSMRNHLSDEDARVNAVKRGGRVEVISLDVNSAERDYSAVATSADTPERAFERTWAMEIVTRAQARLKEECEASGKGRLFAALFSTSESGSGTASSGEETAQRLGMNINTFRSATMRLRQRWKALIRAELSQTVNSQADLEAEMQCLKEALL